MPSIFNQPKLTDKDSSLFFDGEKVVWMAANRLIGIGNKTISLWLRCAHALINKYWKPAILHCYHQIWDTKEAHLY